MIRIIAHRGASAQEPENSLAAFRAALDLGAGGVELDVHTTSDGVPVVHHDDVAGGRLIGATPYSELRDHKLANGETIPTLEAVLSTLGTAIEVFIEIKTLPAAHDSALLAVMDAGPRPRSYHVHSFDHRIVKRIKKRRPSIPTGILSVAYLVDPLAALEAAGAITLWQQERMIDSDLVHTLHRQVFAVHAWTADDAERMKQLADLGVNAICTNRPDVAREVLG